MRSAYLFTIAFTFATINLANAIETKVKSVEDVKGMETSIDEHNVSQILFQNDNDIEAWRRVNDSVMGGVSRSSMSQEGDYGVFSGTLSLDNNGGFASVRRLWTPLDDKTDIKNGTDGKIRLKVVGDGQYYQLRFRTSRYLDGVSYATGFQTKAGELTEHTFALSDFIPVWRGRQVRNVKVLAWEDVVQIGIMITQKQEGPFKLKIASISLNMK